MRHALTAAVAKALPHPCPPAASSYLDLLDRRLAAVEAIADGSAEAGFGEEPAARALARRFLSPLEGTWDDGDENLVRGYLDRWARPGEDPARETARRLTEAARALARIEARPSTFWYFLWQLESMLESLPT
jgi:hypothetical protein